MNDEIPIENRINGCSLWLKEAEKLLMAWPEGEHISEAADKMLSAVLYAVRTAHINLTGNSPSDFLP